MTDRMTDRELIETIIAFAEEGAKEASEYFNLDQDPYDLGREAAYTGIINFIRIKLQKGIKLQKSVDKSNLN